MNQPRPADLQTSTVGAREQLEQLQPGQATAVLYLRVSTKEQAEMGGEAEGFSIPAQRAAGRRKAEALGAVVIDEFVDRGESARSAKRPELQRLLKFVQETHVDYVIVHKVDRLARNRFDDVEINLALKQAGAQLVSVTENIDETPSGLLLHGIMSSIAEFYSRNLANEVIKGSTQKAERGGTPTLAPIGYLNVRRMENGREVRTVEVDPERGPLMAWAFEQYATGDWTIRSLLAELTDKGLVSVPGPRRPSKPLGASQFHRPLHNPYYKGIVRYRGVAYVGTHEPLVDVETWSRVQAVLEAQNFAGEKQRTHRHYLKGSVFCGQCGSRLIVSHAKNRHGTVYPYFICVGRHQKRTGCTQQAMRVEQVESLVEEHYAVIGLTAERAQSIRRYVRDGLSTRRADAELESRQQSARIAQLTNERQKLLQAHYANAIPIDLLKTEQDRIARQLEIAQNRLAVSEQAFAEIETTLEQVLSLARNCQQAYLQARASLRRQFNQAFFEQLLIDEDGTVRSRLAEPFAILLGEELAAEVDAVLTTLPPAGTGENTETAAPWRDSGFWEQSENRPDQRSGQGLKDVLLVEVMGFEPTTSSMRPKRP
jgi:site-specific DNA recombinase